MPNDKTPEALIAEAVEALEFHQFCDFGCASELRNPEDCDCGAFQNRQAITSLRTFSLSDIVKAARIEGAEVALKAYGLDFLAGEPQSEFDKIAAELVAQHFHDGKV